jgi:hypothetical protein
MRRDKLARMRAWIFVVVATGCCGGAVQLADQRFQLQRQELELMNDQLVITGTWHGGQYFLPDLVFVRVTVPSYFTTGTCNLADDSDCSIQYTGRTNTIAAALGGGIPWKDATSGTVTITQNQSSHCVRGTFQAVSAAGPLRGEFCARPARP